MPKTVLRIDDLRDQSIGSIVLDGAMHEVKQLTFALHHDLQTAEGTGDHFEVIKAAIRQIVPTLTEDAVGQLTPRMANAILLFSAGGIAAVEQLFPNVEGPETPTSPG